jgi:hypothetical protein
MGVHGEPTDAQVRQMGAQYEEGHLGDDPPFPAPAPSSPGSTPSASANANANAAPAHGPARPAAQENFESAGANQIGEMLLNMTGEEAGRLHHQLAQRPGRPDSEGRVFVHTEWGGFPVSPRDLPQLIELSGQWARRDPNASVHH